MADEAIGTVALENADDIALAERMKNGREQILNEVRKLIIGQEDVIEEVLLTLFVGGNSLLVGVPGLAKTLLIHTIAQVTNMGLRDKEGAVHRIHGAISASEAFTGRRAVASGPPLSMAADRRAPAGAFGAARPLGAA